MHIAHFLCFCFLAFGRGWVLPQPKQAKRDLPNILKPFLPQPKKTKLTEPVVIKLPVEPVFNEEDGKDEVCMTALMPMFGGSNMAVLSLRSAFDFPEDGIVISAGAPPYPDPSEGQHYRDYTTNNWNTWLSSPWCKDTVMRSRPTQQWSQTQLSKASEDARTELVTKLEEQEYRTSTVTGVYKGPTARSLIVYNTKNEDLGVLGQNLREQFSQDSYLQFSGCDDTADCVRNIELVFGPSALKDPMELGTIGVYSTLPEDVDAYIMAHGKYFAFKLNPRAQEWGYLLDSACGVDE